MLSHQEVIHIARLARIGMKERDIEKFRRDLSSILSLFSALEKIPTDDVEAFDLLPGRANALREDVVRLSNPDERERIVSLFPARLGENLLVKAVF